ncbi:MAG: hypothetical protein ABI443_02220, partial [Chthoniobacterales bacterium]
MMLRPVLKFATPLVCFLGLCISALHAATWKVEAEKAGPGSIVKILADKTIAQPETWIVEKLA